MYDFRYVLSIDRDGRYRETTKRTFTILKRWDDVRLQRRPFYRSKRAQTLWSHNKAYIYSLETLRWCTAPGTSFPSFETSTDASETQEIVYLLSCSAALMYDFRYVLSIDQDEDRHFRATTKLTFTILKRWDDVRLHIRLYYRSKRTRTLWSHNKAYMYSPETMRWCTPPDTSCPLF